jgi:hypothetical protein
MTPFRERDIVRLRRGGAALWRIEELGEQTFYSSGDVLSEDSTRLSLFLPALQRPRCAYSSETFAHRKQMVYVPEMEVLAMVAAAPDERQQAEMAAKWKARLRRYHRLQVQAATFKRGRVREKAKARIKKFVEDNSDLFMSQATFEKDWEFVPRPLVDGSRRGLGS